MFRYTEKMKKKQRIDVFFSIYDIHVWEGAFLDLFKKFN